MGFDGGAWGDIDSDGDSPGGSDCGRGTAVGT